MNGNGGVGMGYDSTPNPNEDEAVAQSMEVLGDADDESLHMSGTYIDPAGFEAAARAE